ncbi:MAG TPA: DUF3667 domain-containing protein [Rhodanobacteraceae bacterium]
MNESHRELERTPPGHRDLSPEHTHCANCGTELLGPFCYQCGQPTKHMLRHLPALAADATDAIFNIDGRIMHTLPALYFRPGFLPREYFAGRRTRYIPPFRLMFFLSVLAFLLIHLALMLDQSLVVRNPVHLSSPTEVHQHLQRTVAHIDTARQKTGLPAIGTLALTLAQREAAVRADHDLRQMHATPLAAASIPAPPSTAALTGQLAAIVHAPTQATVNARADALSGTIAQSLSRIGDASTGATLWLGALDGRVAKARQQGLARHQPGAAADQTPMPSIPPGTLAIPDLGALLAARDNSDHVNVNLRGANHLPRIRSGWLPQFLRNRMNAGIEQADANLSAMNNGTPASRQHARRRVIRNMLAVTPQALFVLIPLLALLLKILYVFKSRLYIEHLIIALYSHAFIFLTLFLSVLLGLITWKLPDWANVPASWLQAALWIWLAVYLLLMQKRVYRQGWFFTVVKYGVTGICYNIMLLFAIAMAALIGLAS